MAQIKNLQGLTADQINTELTNGAKFLIFQYCISIIVMTFKRSSDVYFVKARESTSKYSIGFTIVTLLLGWWGIPWSPVYTIGSLRTNLSGGKDVTNEILQSINS